MTSLRAPRILILAFLLVALSLSEATWYNTSWNYCIQVNVTGAYSTPYTHNLTLNTSLVNYSRISANGTDLRFLEGTCSSPNTTAGVLPYWVESWNTSGDSYIFTKPVNANITTLAMYYNNSAASDLRDINNTFIFGDEFGGSSLDAGKWNWTSNNGYLIANLTNVSAASNNYVARMLFSITDSNADRNRFKVQKSSTPMDWAFATDCGYFDVGGIKVYWGGATTAVYAFGTQYYHEELFNASSTKWNNYLTNRSVLYNNTASNSGTPTSFIILAGGGDGLGTSSLTVSNGSVNTWNDRVGGGNITLAWFYVRLGSLTPPTYAFGAEESAPAGAESIAVSSITETVTSYNYLASLINVTATITTNNTNVSVANITITRPSGTTALSANMSNTSLTAFYYNATLVPLDETGVWFINISANSTLNNVSSVLKNFTVNKNVNASAADNYYGFDTKDVPTTAFLDSLLTNYSYNLVGIQFAFDTLQTNWSAIKTDINYSLAAYNANSFLLVNLSAAAHTDSTAACANITQNLTDLRNYPYNDATAFIVIDVNASATGNATQYANNVSKCIMNATNNLFPVYSAYQNASLDADYVANWTMIQIAYPGDLAGTVNLEAGYLRNSTSLIRIYSGDDLAFRNFTRDYHNGIVKNFRDKPAGNTSIDDTQVALLKNGDFVVFNNGTAASLSVNNSAIANGSMMWDFTHKNLTRVVLNTTNQTVYADESSATLLFVDTFDRFTMSTSTLASLSKATAGAKTGMNYSFNTTGEGTYSIVGARDARHELWSPDYGYYGLEFHTYEQLEYSQEVNFSAYDIIVIAKSASTNLPATVNASLMVTDYPTILGKTYGYISVADYNNTNSSGGNETNCDAVNPWETMKKLEADNWTDNYSVNVFIDGFDIGYVSTPDCFEKRIKRVADHIRVDKGKKTIFNTYTIYQTVANYGDKVMRESCFSRWAGDVSAPTYSYENMTLMIANANYLSAIGKPVVCMAFGDVNDYDKMAYDYLAYAVLYGADGNNTFRYAQPNFQLQREIRVPNLGSMMETGYTQASGTDWTRRYANGVAHFNPYRNATYANGKYFWFDDGKVVNEMNLTLKFQIYGSTCASSADMDVDIQTPEGNTTKAVLACDVGTVQWSAKTMVLNITGNYSPAGHYYIWVRPNQRAYPTGLNLYNTVNTVSGVHSWYDTSANNPPTAEADWTSYGRSGVVGDPNTTNWEMHLSLNASTRAVVDSNVTTITMTSTALDYNTQNVTIASTKSYNLSVLAPTVYVANTYLKSILFNGTALNYSTDASCDTGEPVFNYSTVNGEQHGACRKANGSGYTYRILAPSMSDKEYDIEGEPVVATLTAPSGNTTNRTILFGWTCYFNVSAALTAKLYLNGALQATESCQNNTACGGNVTTPTCGNWNWSVECTDGAGYGANSTNGTVWAQPAFTLFPANASSYSSGSLIYFSANTTCNSTAGNFTVNGTALEAGVSGEALTANSSINGTGSYLWNLTVYDAQGTTFTSDTYTITTTDLALLLIPVAGLGLGAAAYILYRRQRGGGMRLWFIGGIL